MEHLTVMIKLASSLCNMRCRYCFYCDEAENRTTKSYGIMAESTVTRIIEEAFDAATQSVSFMFQGGEPTLAGLDYFHFFAGKVKQQNMNRIKVFYSIQTNGLDISEDFAKFFAENGFLVGLSLDGYRELHDFFRIDAGGYPTHSKVLKTAKLFDRYKVEYNILTVTTAYTAKHIEKIYSFFKNCGFRYLQFIPCLAPLGSEPFSLPHALTPALYEEFLTRLFKLYFADFMAGNYISIRFFDNLVNIAAGQPSEQCGMQGYCPGQLIIEGDGSVFPCDFYCVDYWRLGNIKEMSIEAISKTEKMKEFRTSSLHDDEKCKTCDVYDFCRGGCRRDRDLNIAGAAGENIYCDALYNFFTYAKPYLAQIVKRLQTQG